MYNYSYQKTTMNTFTTMSVFLVSILPLFTTAQNTSCELYTTSQVYYAGFPYKHTTTTFNDGTLAHKTVRNNYVSLQLIAYDNGKFGHYVYFYDNTEKQFKKDNVTEAIVSSSIGCESKSVKPKDLSRMFVQGVNGTSPFETGNETSKVLNGSVTLKCTASCWYYNTTSGEYNSTCPQDLIVPSTVSLKFGLNVTVSPESFSSSNVCVYTSGQSNATTDCYSSSVHASSYSSRQLNSSLIDFKARVFTSSTDSTVYRTIVKPHYLSGKFSYLNYASQYHSVCGQQCRVLEVSS
jgi:hypothetical protein